MMNVIKINATENAKKMNITISDGIETTNYERTVYYNTRKNVYAAYIGGFKITFTYFNDNDWNVESIEEKYKTTGIKKTRSGKGNNVEKVQEVEEPKIKPVEVKGEIHHEQYDNIKACLEANIPVYLTGPAGSGKNHTVEQIAKELGWDFYFSNSVQQEFKLTGFIDAGGKFHETEFYKACTSENDSVFFLDEMDASIPEVLVLLNAAIANGYFEFPTGRVNLNKVHFVAAGNTVGSGADEMYTGRLVLDQATLDRFAIIEFDYSLNIEMAITKNNSELVNFIRGLRKEAEENGIRATFSYRCLTMVTKLEKSNMDLKMILKIAVFKGLDKDTINTFSANGVSKYEQAFREMKRVA
jgi:cobaltochelatase CobS